MGETTHLVFQPAGLQDTLAFSDLRSNRDGTMAHGNEADCDQRLYYTLERRKGGGDAQSATAYSGLEASESEDIVLGG